MAQLTFASRFALTIVIVLVILFAMAAFGYFGGRWTDDAAGETLPPTPSSIYDARIAEIERQAIDGAFQEHIRKLYSTWMADPYNAEAPTRAGRGARNGRKAYIDAMTAVDRRYPR